MSSTTAATTEKQGLERTISEVGKELIKIYHCKTLKDTKEIRFFSMRGRYEDGGKEIIETTVRQQIAQDISRHDLNEIIYYVQTSTYTDRSEFDKDPYILNLKNGLLNFKTGEFTEHTPEYLSTLQLPISYDPKATCKEIIHFLYNVIADPTNVPLFLEYLAYCLFADKDLQKELLEVGAPASGKSVSLNLITAFLGNENVSNVTLQQLSTNRFALAQLYGKLANIYADISHARLEDLERFKAIATSDEVEAEKKGMQLFKFRPRAKLIFSANIPPRPPITVDDSYYRRWLIIQFAIRDNDYFTGKPIVKDSKIIQKLTTPEQLSGLLNLVLISARRLIKRQRFCKEISTDETRELYDRLSNPVRMWVESCCEDDEDGYIEKDARYTSYVKFCNSRKIGATTKEWLGKELSRLGYVDGKKGDSRKHQVKAWLGLRLKEDNTGTGSGSSPFTTDNDNSNDVGTGKTPFPSLTNSNDNNDIVKAAKDPLPSPSEQIEVHYCQFCNRAFATKEQVDEHCRTFHQDKEAPIS